jgi:peptidyl-tRNA hydrolase
MEPKLLPGDTVLFEKVPDDEIANGAMVLVTLLNHLQDGAYVVKYLQWARNGESKVILTAEDGTKLEEQYDGIKIEGRYWKLIRD